MKLYDPGQAPAPAVYTLDVRPLAQPMSPWAYMAAELEAADYPTPADRTQAQQCHAWMRHLEAHTSGIVSSMPLDLAAMARLAVDGKARALFSRAIAAIEAEIARSDGHGSSESGDEG